MSKNFKKLVTFFMSLSLVMSMFGAVGTIDNSKNAKAEDATFTDLDQASMVEDMGAGWNLGNQLEASNNGTPSETAWGNPKVSEDLIKLVKSAGFKTIRIPVSYLSKITYNSSTDTYEIDSAWLTRVKEVVDYCVNNDVYAIINMHGDGYNSVQGGWLLCNGDDQDTIKKKYADCWNQIATTFKDYDEHLIFESMNEEFDGTYSNPNKTYYANINAYNQIFVDTVRQTGSNNAKRWLLIPGWNTNINYTVGNYGFSLPTDNYLDSSVSGKRIMISVHYYDPWDFAGEGSTTQWGPNAESGKASSWGQLDYMEDQFNKLYNTFVSKGYPVVIGEYGATDVSSTDPNNLSCRKDYYYNLCKIAKEKGCVPVTWDNNGHNKSGGDQFGLFNRSYLIATTNGQAIIDSIMEVYGSEEESPSPEVSESPSESPEASATASESPAASEEVSESPAASESASAEASESPAASEEASASPAASTEASASPAASASPSASASAAPATSSLPSASPEASAEASPSSNTVKAKITTNLKNNKKYSKAKKVIVKANKGIKKITLNGKKVKCKAKKKKFTFKLKKYKKYLKKRKKNKLIVIDMKKNKKIVKFVVK
ncbi:MAG: glycoside hydrolase family 5 protein [Lachnospiraceae bacterium]|nr:glycoside hydrolase family 5 protein [Lachnospiraceae bacterium]